MRCSLALALAVAVLLAACTPAICSRSSDCATGLVCTTIGRCEVPVDASLVDAAGHEAGATEIHDASIDASTDDAPPDVTTDAQATDTTDADTNDPFGDAGG